MGVITQDSFAVSGSCCAALTPADFDVVRLARCPVLLDVAGWLGIFSVARIRLAHRQLAVPPGHTFGRSEGMDNTKWESRAHVNWLAAVLCLVINVGFDLGIGSATSRRRS